MTQARKKGPKFRTSTVYLDSFEDAMEALEALQGFDGSFITRETTSEELYARLEEFLLEQGWTHQERWYTSDSDAASFAADAVGEAVEKGHTRALIVDDNDDNAYFWSK